LVKSKHKYFSITAITVLIALLHASLFAGDAIPREQVAFFEQKIRPVLAESCYECHNSVSKQKAKLALDYKDASTLTPGKLEIMEK